MRRAKQEEYWSGSSMMCFKTGPGLVWINAMTVVVQEEQCSAAPLDMGLLWVFVRGGC